MVLVFMSELSFSCSFPSRKELVDPSGLSEEQLKEIPYTKIEYVFENLS